MTERRPNARPRRGGPLRLTLYVAGDNAFSRRAKDNLRTLLAEADIGVRLAVIDVLQDPERALRERIFATPALVVLAAGGRRSLIVGDLSERDKVRSALRG